MKITEIFKTKYLASHWKRDLSYFLELLTTDKRNKRWDAIVDEVRSTGNPYMIDLAGARICRDVMIIICNYNNKDVKFIDTEDAVRNGMLEENYRRRELSYDVVPLPMLTDLKDFPSYLMSLDPTVVYGRGNMSIGLLSRLVFEIQVYRPEITMDLTSAYEEVYNYMSTLIGMGNRRCDKVNYVIGDTVFTQDVNPDNTVYVPGEGNIPWNSFVTKYSCIPAELGTKRLSMDEEWRSCVKRCLDEIPNFLERHTSITDFFGKE